MDRRTFARTLSWAIGTVPMSVRVAVAGLLAGPAIGAAQTKDKIYRIGYASLRAGPSALEEGFLGGLRDLGYVDGRNVVIEYRWANNDMARFQTQVEELVRLKVDVIVTSSTAAVRVAMRATTSIPIVIAASGDPVGTGLVADYAHPGGNVTGMSLLSTDLARKRLQLLRELLPAPRRVAVLAWNTPDAATLPAGRGATDRMIAETRAAGQQMGVDVSPAIVADAGELPKALAPITRDRVQAVIVQNNSIMFENRAQILSVFSRERLPAMYEGRDYTDDGGLISYGPDVRDNFCRAADYVDKILKGARPGDLAIQQPSKLELVINLKAAKALGIAIPQSLLLRAEVIQ